MPKPFRLLLSGAALIAVAACSSPSRPPWADGAFVREEVPPGQPPQSLADLPARLLAVHNRERAAVGVPALSWDATLAAGATAYARQLTQLGRLQHSPRDARPGQGENLWMGTAGAYSPEDMAGSWADERRYFRAGTFPNVSTSGNWSDVAHYTQMIWRSTTRVGCGVARGGGWDVLVCRYAPAGNVTGQPVP